MKSIAGGLLVFINGDEANYISCELSRHYWLEPGFATTVITSDFIKDINSIVDILIDKLRNGSILFLSNTNDPETLNKIIKSGLLIDDEGWTVTINITPKEETDDKPTMNTLSYVVLDNILENCIDIIDNLIQRSAIIEDNEINILNYHK